jgi:CBS domain-containing protein
VAGQAVARAGAAGWDLCVVVNEFRVVAGVLRSERLEPDDTRPAAEAMVPGPATVRAHEDLAPTRARMAERKVRWLLVTTPDGELLGMLHVED